MNHKRIITNAVKIILILIVLVGGLGFTLENSSPPTPIANIAMISAINPIKSRILPISKLQNIFYKNFPQLIFDFLKFMGNKLRQIVYISE